MTLSSPRFLYHFIQLCGSCIFMYMSTFPQVFSPIKMKALFLMPLVVFANGTLQWVLKTCTQRNSLDSYSIQPPQVSHKKSVPSHFLLHPCLCCEVNQSVSKSNGLTLITEPVRCPSCPENCVYVSETIGQQGKILFLKSGREDQAISY